MLTGRPIFLKTHTTHVMRGNLHNQKGQNKSTFSIARENAKQYTQAMSFSCTEHDVATSPQQCHYNSDQKNSKIAILLLHTLLSNVKYRNILKILFQ